MPVNSFISHQYWKKVALVGLLYGCTGWLSYTIMDLGTTPSPIWFPAGIALTALLFWGERVALGIFLGDFLLTFLGLKTSWEIALASAFGSTISALFGVKLLRYGKFSASLERIRDVIVFVFLAALLSPTLNATIDTLMRGFVGQLPLHHIWQNWSILWLGDSTGILMITPLLLRYKLDKRNIFKQKSFRGYLEAGICLGLLITIAWVVFSSQGILVSNSENPFSKAQYLEYLPFPFVVWAAMRFHVWGAIIANLSVSLFALVGVLEGVGPFILQTPNLNQAVLLLDVFLAIITATSLFLAAAIVERERIDKQLRTMLERENLVANVAIRVHQSLDFKEVLHTTVEEIRHFLNADRVYIAYVHPKGQVKIVAESIVPEFPSLIEWTPNRELVKEIRTLFSNNNSLIADNTAKVDTSPALQTYYRQFGIKASLVLPLRSNQQLLGALVVHQYSHVRHWQKSEVKVLEQLATQVSIAIQQAQLYQRVQRLNTNLEQEVEERTLQLREKMQELQRFYDMKNVFLQAVSHDLRTSIMGLVMLLKNKSNCSGNSVTFSRSILNQIIQSSDRQITLINALCEDHFAEQRPLILHPQPLALREIVDRLLQDWETHFQQNQTTVLNLIPEDLPLISADACQIRQVFENLITNALKHNPPGIHLTLNANVDRDMIRCILADNGVGMDEGQCQRLFKLYLRSLHNHRLTGIGLGSYQCRQIIEAHGGIIGVKSSPQVGSQFWFTLPTCQPTSELLAGEKESSKIGRNSYEL